ncbi:hypothetical protein [Thalassobacillus hwangdonensis]|uniref:Sulfotransferase domain-containing protein n=1 Tax=Thalassobacillus hwangdonensis TaxID=546108 RepID=A0ABW3L324_9BACI
MNKKQLLNYRNNLLNYIKKRPFLYSKMKYVFEKENYYKNVTNKNTELCVEAYPSSGNTLLMFMIQNYKEDINMSHHTHTLANIKLAKNKNIPCIVIIRDPINAISSYVYRFTEIHLINEKKINQEMLKYKDFYTYVLNNRDSFLIIDFNDLITKPEQTLKTVVINNKLFNTSKEKNWRKLIEQANDDVKNKAIKKGRLTKGSFPSEEKEKGKNKIKKIIIENRHYDEIEDLYSKIVAGGIK